jgi:Domain of unknown function (DUF4188)
MVRPGRLTVTRDEGFVVFLIGARANKWWMLPALYGVAAAMGRMMRELQADPDAGLLAFEAYTGRTTLTVQYWRSLEHLQAYAHNRERAHVPAWKRYMQSWGLGSAIGVWHETYVVAPGSYETVYVHMPAFGLGKVGPLAPADGALRTAAGRMGRGEE